MADVVPQRQNLRTGAAPDLGRDKYDAWLDWQGIPPTATWWQEAECIAPTGCMRLEICSALTLSHQSGHTVVMRSPILQLLPR
jgi:hypothetical protein